MVIGEAQRGSPESAGLPPCTFPAVVYYYVIKRELNRRLIYECRCDESLKAKVEGSTLLAYTGLRGGLVHLKIDPAQDWYPCLFNQMYVMFLDVVMKCVYK